MSNYVLEVMKVLYYSSPIWLTAFLIALAWDLWVQWRRAIFFAKQTYVLLEIKLPKEIYKNPRAMEFCIAGMWQPGLEKNWFEKYWKGQVRTEFSLEIASIDGAVHFFIRTKKGNKNQIEANLYSQYPGIEIYEVPDYTLPFSYDSETQSFWKRKITNGKKERKKKLTKSLKEQKVRKVRMANSFRALVDS